MQNLMKFLQGHKGALEEAKNYFANFFKTNRQL